MTGDSAVETRRAQYAEIFARECAQTYPVIDARERQCGYALDRWRLTTAARVLACPVKLHPPNWQHGRLLYALTRQYLDTATPPVQILDLGTAKGFSALCLQWALLDSGVAGAVTSVDVIDPESLVPRNSVADLDGSHTIRDLLTPWPEAQAITFLQMTGVQWLDQHPGRVQVAFVDGKHSGIVVAAEGYLLTARQHPGDLAIFDDVHLPPVAAAQAALETWYTFERIELLPQRHYAIGRRR